MPGVVTARWQSVRTGLTRGGLGRTNSAPSAARPIETPANTSSALRTTSQPRRRARYSRVLAQVCEPRGGGLAGADRDRRRARAERRVPGLERVRAGRQPGELERAVIARDREHRVIL